MTRSRRVLAVLVPLAAALVFVGSFDYAVNVWWVNLVWLTGVLCAVFAHAPAPRGAAWPWRRFVPLLPLLVAVSAFWLPCYDNWRWVGGGDSFGWFLIPERAASNGPALSVLSVAGGPFEFFTHTSVLVDNALMFVFAPTFFWHRASKLLLTLFALTSMYAYFATVWRPRWALALCIAAATNFLLIWMSFLSFNHIDSFVFGFLTLLLTALIFRDPARRWCWGAAGACGGVSLLFTGTAWSDVVACGFALLVFGLARRCWDGLSAYFVAAGVAVLPVVVQLSAWIERQMAQSALGPELELGFWEQRWRVARITLALPFGANIDVLDHNGSFFFWPVGPLYAIGLALAVLSLLPWARRVLDLPRAAAGLLALYLWSVFLQAMTTSYGWPSWKRSFYLIPLQIFFALLPLSALTALLRRWRAVHAVAIALVFVAVAAYGAANLHFLVHPRPRNWGNEMDAFVQVHQRFAQRPVTIFAPGAEERPYLEDPSSDWNRAYRISNVFRPQAPLELVDTLDPAWVDGMCPSERVLCYEVSPANRESFAAVTRAAAEKLRRVPIYWNAHLICYECASG